jgi:hypothetical protein
MHHPWQSENTEGQNPTNSNNNSNNSNNNNNNKNNNKVLLFITRERAYLLSFLASELSKSASTGQNRKDSLMRLRVRTERQIEKRQNKNKKKRRKKRPKKPERSKCRQSQ